MSAHELDSLPPSSNAATDYTAKHRETGVPFRASPLELDPKRAEDNGLSNPLKLITEYNNYMAFELAPPQVHEFSAEHMAEPHYRELTNNLKVRLTDAPLPGTMRETNKALTWHKLTKDEVSQKVKESEGRRRAMSKKMKKDQEDLEFK